MAELGGEAAALSGLLCVRALSSLWRRAAVTSSHVVGAPEEGVWKAEMAMPTVAVGPNT